MRAMLRTAATPVWALLMAATAVSLWLGAGQRLGAGERKLATVLVMVVAFVKVQFIGRYFMELRDAPLVLRTIFNAWCAIWCSVSVVFYLAG